MNKRAVGARYEERAAAFLADCGYRIVARNFRSGRGELDIVALDRSEGKTVLVFVEVKYRTSPGAGHPEEALTPSKCRTICRAADYYCVRYKIRSGTPCRFDVIAFEGERLRHIRNAFDYLI